MTETTPTITPRRPHFRRHAPQPVLITDDDIAIIRHVAEHRFRRSTDLCRLLSHRPTKKVVERLTSLYHAGFLDRPRAQREYFHARKRPAYIYALGNHGAALIAELDGVEAPRTDWTDKNRDLGRTYMHHQLLVSDVLIAIRLAVQARDDVKFIEPAEILARSPEATRRLANPWKWRAKVPYGIDNKLMDLALVPDAVFGLDLMSQRKRVYFMLEADRATMPVWRSSLMQTSVYKKCLTYFHGYRARNHERMFGIGNFRVLTVTTSRERKTSIINVIKTKVASGGSNMFLLTDAATIANAPDVLSLAWTSAKDQAVRLID